MVKIIFFVIFVISTFCGSSTSTNIECNYDYEGYSVVGRIYRCEVNDLSILTKESAKIKSISGTHKGSKIIDAIGISAEDQTIQFFPKGLEKFFKNLKMITIDSCQLKEIHQSDLKVFPNLVYFDLTENEIKIIEAGLFEFNPNLEVVAFWESNIIHIDPNVFDHLTKLNDFWFDSVPCVHQDIKNSREEVEETIKIVKSNCSDPEFLSLKNQIKIQIALNLDANLSSKFNLTENEVNSENSLGEATISTTQLPEVQNFSTSVPYVVNSENRLGEVVISSTQIDKVQNISTSNESDLNLSNKFSSTENYINSGINLKGTIILTLFMPLLLHFLPTFYYY